MPNVCQEQGETPPDDPIAYQPTTWPGARLPSVFLEDGGAVFDLFQFTEPAIREIYERDYLLVRPITMYAGGGMVYRMIPAKNLNKVTGH